MRPGDWTAESALAHLLAARSLALVSVRSPRDEGDGLALYRRVAGDPLLPALPPLGLMMDVLAVIAHHDSLVISRRALPDAALDRAYRIGVLYRLLRDDPSVERLRRVIRSRGPAGRRQLIAFVALELARTLAARSRPGRLAMIPAPLIPERLAAGADEAEEEGGSQQPAEDAVRAALADALDDLRSTIEAWPDGPLFSQEQVTVLSYLRDEADAVPLRLYHAVDNLLPPVQVSVARRARQRPSVAVEVAHRTAAAVGGYAGIEGGGGPDELGRVLPSELARMEPGPALDAFDVDLMEQRLLTYRRAHFLDIYPARRCVMVLADLPALDFLPLFLPARWWVVMLSILFDRARFHRDHPSLARDTFDLVLVGGGPVQLATRLFDVIADRDLGGHRPRLHVLPPAALEGWYESELGAGGPPASVVEIAPTERPRPVRMPAGIARQWVRCETAGHDRVRVDDGPPITIGSAAEVPEGLRLLRDTLLVGPRSAPPEPPSERPAA